MATQVGSLLEQLMAKAGVDETRLSKATKIAKANISRLKNDPKANPTLATLRPIAEFFGITVSQLVGESPIESQILSSNKTVSRIPVIKWHSISQYITEKVAHSSNWLSTEHQLSEKAFAVQVQDKTMVALFPPHALLIIDKLEEYKDGMYILVKEHNMDEPFLKQLIIDGNVKLLKSLKIGINRIDNLLNQQTILGAVVEVRYHMQEQ